PGLTTDSRGLAARLRRRDRLRDLARPQRHVAARQDEERVDPGDLTCGQPHVPADVVTETEAPRLERAEQPVVEMAARRVAGRPFVAEELAGPDRLADLHPDFPEVGVDRAIAIAIVDDDDDR